MKKFVLVCAIVVFFGNSAVDKEEKPVVRGRLMIIPRNVVARREILMHGMVYVWAYNKYSVHWHVAGYPDLDRGKRRHRFPLYIPYETLQYLHEGSLFVFEQNGKEFMLTCANNGTRYGGKPFEYYLKQYAGVVR